MMRNRKGVTLVEIILVIAVIAMLIAGVVLWQRVQKLNTWAVGTDAWLTGQLYPWVKNNSFQVGSSGGNPDGSKPPPPPDGL